MTDDNTDSDHPRDEGTDWEDTELWEGVEDAKHDRIVRLDYEFEF